MFDIEKYSEYSHFRQNLKNRKSFVITGLTSITRLFLLCSIKNILNKKIIFITSSEQNALKYKNDLQKLLHQESEVFPFQNVSMYESLATNKYEYARQINILQNQPDVIIAPVKSLLEKFPSAEFFDKNKILLSKGLDIDLKSLIQKLVDFGYQRATMVTDIGEFSVRGDIIDIFTLAENPVRIELWGDEIVDIRYFNNETQKSIEHVDNIEILPAYKFLLENKLSIPNYLATKFEEEDGFFDGIELYQAYFNEQLVPVWEYFKDYIIVFDEMSEIYSKYEFIEESYNKQIEENNKLELNEKIERFNHVTLTEFKQATAGFPKIGLNNFIDADYDDLLEFNSSPIRTFDADIELIANFIKSKQGYNIYIATDFPDRVRELLTQQEIFDVTFTESIAFSGSIIEDLKVVVLTDRELFNKRSKEVTSGKRTYYKEKAEFIENINDIKDGEYVVHSIHGVGIYRGLSQQEIDGQFKDYLTIEYAGKDRLHIPAEQINLLCRYRGSGTVKPKLSRMGGSDWENTKTKVKKAVEEVAYDLLRLYARRRMQKGIQFEPDTPWQVEMEDAFEYTETPDQMKAIEEIKRDMESENPMDRLVCGDVGFGKTEVAMRAIFKAVTSGKQVAVIVPTTILALQHFQTISERFKPFAMKVDLLCRFRSPKQQKETLKNLALGSCDVVVSTHRLLQDGVMFKDLGLLVIDEEHRFGVRHKEKLKQLRENIDIISMSATPIPRTLYMSLSGIKDMSVINTPPKNRLPIKTLVGEFNDLTLKNAIIHELDREGQIYYLYNRVETILEMKHYLQELVPQARIAVGHGQLSEKELEEVIVAFSNHEYDILLSTTIIENGLDIPNANTMIVHDADKFGLAQLYQLRGRVGRSERQAYCYCFYKQNKLITNEAKERLKAIKEFTTLGSGYQIAMRDVEIRGVGNILGTKQHGHMINVGFDTYCQLLDDVITELKGEKVEEKSPTIIDINVTAFIPDEWVGSAEQKMIEYKRLADVKNETELDYVISEWKDRFAKSPESVENLIKLIRLRLLATQVNVSLIRETPENIRIYTPFTQMEWNIIQCALPKNITKYVKFTIAPKSCQDARSIILLNNSYLNFNELFNIMTDLFYHINKVSYEYKKEGE